MRKELKKERKSVLASLLAAVLTAALLFTLALASPGSLYPKQTASANQKKRAAVEKPVSALAVKNKKEYSGKDKKNQLTAKEKSKRMSDLKNQEKALDRDTDRNREIDLHQKTYTKKQYKEILKQAEKGKWKKLGNRRWSSYCPVCNTPANSYASSSGIKLFDGCVASKYLPLGTIIKMKGKIYMVTDRCGTDAIDIFHDTPNGCRCNSIGTGYADVYVLLDAGQSLPKDKGSNLRCKKSKKTKKTAKTKKSKKSKKKSKKSAGSSKTGKTSGTTAGTGSKGNDNNLQTNQTKESTETKDATCSVYVINGTYVKSVVDRSGDSDIKASSSIVVKYSPKSSAYKLSRLVIDGTAVDLSNDSVYAKYKDEVSFSLHDGKNHTVHVEYSLQDKTDNK